MPGSWDRILQGSRHRPFLVGGGANADTLKINVIVGRPSVAFVELGRNALDDKPALPLGAIDDVFQHVVEETAVGLLVACCAGNTVLAADRSEERRVGKECFRTCRYRWAQLH